MKEKSEVGQIFQNFNSMIKTQFQTRIQVLRTDNGKEYVSLNLNNYLVKGRNCSPKLLCQYSTTKWSIGEKKPTPFRGC